MHFLPARKALKPELSYREARIVWLLRAAIVGLGLYAFVVKDLAFTTRPVLVTTALVGLVVSLFFAFVETERPRTLSLAEAAMLLAILLHLSGHAFGLYERIPLYDLALHYSMPLVVAGILYALSQATDWIWDWREVTPLEVGIYLYSMSLAIAAMWEGVEFLMDAFAGTSEQDNLVDTMIDLFADMAGAATGAILLAGVTAYGRKHGPEAISEEPDEGPRGDGVSEPESTKKRQAT